MGFMDTCKPQLTPTGYWEAQGATGTMSGANGRHTGSRWKMLEPCWDTGITAGATRIIQGDNWNHAGFILGVSGTTLGPSGIIVGVTGIIVGSF